MTPEVVSTWTVTSLGTAGAESTEQSESGRELSQHVSGDSECCRKLATESFNHATSMRVCQGDIYT